MIGVVATLRIKPGMEKNFEVVAKELVAKVRANEPGCVLYALHQGEPRDLHLHGALHGPGRGRRPPRHRLLQGARPEVGEYMDGRAEVMRLREVE